VANSQNVKSEDLQQALRREGFYKRQGGLILTEADGDIMSGSGNIEASQLWNYWILPISRDADDEAEALTWIQQIKHQLMQQWNSHIEEKNRRRPS